MRANVIKELLLYQYRYVLGYTILVFLSISLTAWQLADIPPGFSELEKQSAVISSQLSYHVASFINLPYHMLQKVSLELFGPDAFGIRLPSVICALLVVAATYLLLKRWFGESVAVIGALLVITSVHFLLRARSGNPLILYYLWPALLLLTASMANFQREGWRFWVWLFAAVAALSLYTPYLGFLLIIILLAVTASRQGRALVADIGGPTIALSIMTFLVLTLPLSYSFYEDPQAVMTYVGIAETPNIALVLERLKELMGTLAGLGNANGFYPVLSIPALIFSLYGAFYTLKTASRSRYAIIALWLLAALALFLSARQVPIAILFVPIALLIVIGLWRFIQHWYDLFPRNPYARVAALLPIALLLLVMIQFNYQRYFYWLPHSEGVRSTYDGDILLVDHQLAAGERVGTTQVVVPPDEQAFFGLLENHHRLMEVTTVADPDLNLQGNDIIIAESEFDKLSASEVETLSARGTELAVDGRPGEEALRFRIYR